MMDELKQQFYEVMHKYQKPFSEEGVVANLTQWYEQKQGLLQLLRKHPLWNEKELAIVFRVEERREIDRITVDETRAAILELGRRACTDDTVYENFETALRAATADYARIPNEYRLDTIRQYGGIKCAPGQKSSRIINRLCLKFHLEKNRGRSGSGRAGQPLYTYSKAIQRAVCAAGRCSKPGAYRENRSAVYPSLRFPRNVQPRQHLEFLPLLRKGQLSRRLPVLYGRCRQYDFLHGQ